MADQDSVVRVAVVGATGYTGAELVRLLWDHPHTTITVATSERDAGRALGQVHPSLAATGLELCKVDVDVVAAGAEVAFTALPHGTSAGVVADLLDRGLKVIDLGADFRFRDLEAYEAAYQKHEAPQLLEKAVYGLSEFARGQVAEARLVANPGCYPTGALMALLPLATHLKGPVMVDSKSGTSGAGRQADSAQLFAEIAGNIRPYKVGQHRHQPEMASLLWPAAGRDVPILFSPHLLPIARGLLTSCYVDVGGQDVTSWFEDAYANEPFVRLLGPGGMPEPRRVRGTNLIEIGWVSDGPSGRTVVFTAIDNLGKGAAGQAVQNLNIMMGWQETSGLLALPVLP
ncbi:MAG: N-acetyl-gamma-glutamyl-phosphate reductase [Deltaproteobacteria bacterium]